MTACGARETFETISDVYDVSAMARLQQVKITLPEDASVESMGSGDSGELYLCDGYCVTVQTMEAGDLDRTLRQTTGFSKDQLTVMQTRAGNAERYEFVWSAAGEAEDQMCRAVVLDDGAYHYVVTVMAEASQAGELAEVWQHILDSVTLVSID